MTGFGLNGLSWGEIESWSKLAQKQLTPTESRTLYILSHTYANAFESAKSENAPPPFVPDDEENRKHVSMSLKAILDAMIVKQKSKKDKHG